MITTVAVIDYGMGNLHSVANALERVSSNTRVLVTRNEADIRAADRVVFPGVGAIADCMAEIRSLGFDRLLPEMVAEKPVFAICVGMQALLDRSEENGGVDCIGLLHGEVKLFGDDLRDANDTRLKVPHMGWNNLHQTQTHPLWWGVAQDSRFYFVHSYYAQVTQRKIVYATCDYGVQFDAVLATKNLFAVQFHPEKSHNAGLQLLKNFMMWNGHC